MLEFLLSINVKDNSCDLFKIYIYLVLTENWLLYDSTTKEKSLMFEMWGVFLRNCSCQISSTDLRPHASKVCCLISLNRKYIRAGPMRGPTDDMDDRGGTPSFFTALERRIIVGQACVRGLANGDSFC